MERGTGTRDAGELGWAVNFDVNTKAAAWDIQDVDGDCPVAHCPVLIAPPLAPQLHCHLDGATVEDERAWLGRNRATQMDVGPTAP